eukprot:EG_transcript_15707
MWRCVRAAVVPTSLWSAGSRIALGRHACCSAFGLPSRLRDGTGSRPLIALQCRPFHVAQVRLTSRPPIGPEPQYMTFLSKWGPLGAAAALLVGKWKSVFVLLKMAKLAPLLQIGASVAVYAVFLGWQYSAGIVALMFVHELGHVLALTAFGLKPGPITFIPFLGAHVQMNRLPSSAFTEAIVALAGPVVGGATSIGVLLCAIHTGSPLVAAIADFGVLVNLLNLVPFSMLDGGRIVKALDRRIMLLGIPMFAAVAYLYSNPILVLFLIMGVFTTAEAFQGQKVAEGFYAVHPAQRAFVAVAYVACIVVLMIAFEVSQEVKTPPDQLGAAATGGRPSQVLQWYEDLSQAVYKDDSVEVVFDTTKPRPSDP